MKLQINLDDGMTKYTSNVSKRKFGGILTNLQAQNGSMAGSAFVEYAKGYRNSFDFSDLNDLKQKMDPCLEKELMNDFAVL